MYFHPADDLPADWREYSIIDLATGQEVSDCIECDTAAGWCVCLVRKDGKPVICGYELKTKRLEGAFKAVRHYAM